MPTKSSSTKYIQKRPDKIPFTKDAYEKIQAEYKELEIEDAAILIRLQKAREMGDLSENGAYKYAKFELGNVRRKLRTLRHQIRYGEIVEKKAGGAIDFGNTITLKNSKAQITFTLVSKHESDPGQKKLSTDSPFGKAVIGKNPGDKITVSAPAGKIEYQVLKVS